MFELTVWCWFLAGILVPTSLMSKEVILLFPQQRQILNTGNSSILGLREPNKFLESELIYIVNISGL
jgi:hypothetical protein